jgi:DNA-directed RNA polymerase subunit K/omega
MSGTAVLAPETSADEPSVAAFENRFLLVTVAFRRVVQIRAGARPRVYIASHRPTVLAVAEVIAGCIPFSTDGPTLPNDGRS